MEEDMLLVQSYVWHYVWGKKWSAAWSEIWENVPSVYCAFFLRPMWPNHHLRCPTNVSARTISVCIFRAHMH